MTQTPTTTHRAHTADRITIPAHSTTTGKDEDTYLLDDGSFVPCEWIADVTASCVRRIEFTAAQWTRLRQLMCADMEYWTAFQDGRTK